MIKWFAGCGNVKFFELHKMPGQKVVRHNPRVYISWRPPHPAESSTTSCRLFQGPQNDWMRTISHTTACPAIHMHQICQFACIYSPFYSVKGHNRTIKSRSGDRSRHLGMWWTIVLHISWSTVKQCKKWFGPRVGLVSSRVHKLSYAKKRFFWFFKLLLWKFSH